MNISKQEVNRYRSRSSKSALNTGSFVRIPCTVSFFPFFHISTPIRRTATITTMTASRILQIVNDASIYRNEEEDKLPVRLLYTP